MGMVDGSGEPVAEQNQLLEICQRAELRRNRSRHHVGTEVQPFERSRFGHACWYGPTDLGADG